jgi:hypothetical protein
MLLQQLPCITVALDTIVTFDTIIALVISLGCPADVITHEVAQETPLECQYTPSSTSFVSL